MDGSGRCCSNCLSVLRGLQRLPRPVQRSHKTVSTIRCNRVNPTQCALVNWQYDMRAQVEELHETQPECRVYIVLTKCDQLPELPSLPGLGVAAHPDPPAVGTPGGGSDDSSNGALLTCYLSL